MRHTNHVVNCIPPHPSEGMTGAKIVERLSEVFKMSVQQPKGRKPPKVQAAKKRKPLWKIRRELKVARLPQRDTVAKAFGPR